MNFDSGMEKVLFDKELSHSYTDRPPRQVPGFEGLHRMMSMLLAERVPPDGRLLVLGAGGGLELRTLADAHPGWSFDGVDPSAQMLHIARQTAGAHVGRIRFVEGYVEDAPGGPYDGATCLLTFHFIPREQRLETLAQLHRRLKPGAPLVLAHISVPRDEPERSTWLARHVAYSADRQSTPAALEGARQAMAERLTILAPEEEEAMLRQAGFSGVALFYAGLSFRGWVAYRS